MRGSSIVPARLYHPAPHISSVLTEVLVGFLYAAIPTRAPFIYRYVAFAVESSTVTYWYHIPKVGKGVFTHHNVNRLFHPSAVFIQIIPL